MSVWNVSGGKSGAVKTPLAIVQDYCKGLSEQTDGKLTAVAAEYGGLYRSTPSQPYAPADLWNKPAFNAQNVMGDADSGDQFVYELFVTSRNTPRYKYRAFIMYYGIALYPVGLTIQEDIAEELNLPAEGGVCKDETAFRGVVERILGSDTLGDVLRHLAALNA